MQPASVSARPRRRSASRSRTSPPSDEIRPPSKAAVTFLRRTAGRWKGRRLSSVMAGVALSLFGKKDVSTTNFYSMATAYATSATPKSDTPVESRTGAPASGSGGLSVAFAPGLSPAPMAAFPVPAHQTGRADFPHPAFGRDHAFACGRPMVLGDRRARPYSSRSLVSGKRTYFPVFTLCLRQSHRRSRRTACRSTAL